MSYRFEHLLIRTLTFGLGLLALTGLCPSMVKAGEYTVRQCAGAGYSRLDSTPSLLGGADRVDFVTGCTPGKVTQIGVSQDRSGLLIADGVGGEFRWEAPSHASITATDFELTMKDANGIKAAPVGSRASGAGIFLDGGKPHDGSRLSAQWSGAEDPLRRVAIRLVCRQAAGCANQPTSTKAAINVFDAAFTLADAEYPVVTVGPLWPSAEGGWFRGNALANVVASDGGGGVSRVMAEVNGLNPWFFAPECPGRAGVGTMTHAVSLVPCPDRTEVARSMDSSLFPFHEGSNRVRFCAEDFATGSSRPNRGCSPTRNYLIDNIPPAAPVGLRTVGGSGWRAVNGFKFTWDDPDGQVSPLAGGSYSLSNRESGEVVAGGELGPGAGGELGPLEVPGPGEYELKLRLRDRAGNLGVAAIAIARFDDRPPGDVLPEPPAGWVSADELPLRQEIARAESRGPSGIGGYALTVSDAGPVPPCPSGLCLAPQLSLTGGVEDRVGSLPGLAEGRHWVSAVAASGAMLASERPGTVTVDVDRTVPRLELSGIPSGWSSVPVIVTATAEDELSGMVPQAGDDGEPETVIEAEGSAPYRVPGASASFTVGEEGVTRLRYWARDLAGNANDGERGPDGVRHPQPSEATVRIDTEPPEPVFVRERNPADPERIEVVLRDRTSGPAEAEIEYRRTGGGEPFRALSTIAGEDGRFAARMPSDDLPSGSYELRAAGTDRAGNVGYGDRTEDGAPMLLTLPLKRPARLVAGFGWKQKPRLRIGFGRRALVTGRLVGAGRGLSGASLELVEVFAAGSRPARRETRVKTDGAGRFAVRLAPGPGRRITVSYPGSPTISRAGGTGLDLAARGKVTLAISPKRMLNGGVARMRGRVRMTGALPPARGKLVAIQYYDPSRARWRPAEVIRARRNGRFRYRYRFRTIKSTQRILFRAVALPEAGWPYLNSTSRSRSVIVSPRR